ncbi:MAG: FtsX-like permease family protein [bacterium]|nr:FtsX-like permease family protein [bacterium]
MKRRAIIKTTTREVRQTFGRFVAIFSIVALGVGFFAGLKVTKPAMTALQQDYLERHNFFDYRLVSSIGFRDEDVEPLAKLSEVEQLEAGYCVDMLCQVRSDITPDSAESAEMVLKVHSIPEKVNTVELIDGRMPKAANECVVDANWIGQVTIGESIKLTDDNEQDSLDLFSERDFTIVGAVRSPYYMNFERGTSAIGDGKITAYFYVPKEAFDSERYTEVFLKLKENYAPYSNEYSDYIDAWEDTVDEACEASVMGQYDELIADAEEELADAKQELADEEEKATAELSDARAELDDAKVELSDAKVELADAKTELDDARKELIDAKTELADSKEKLASAKRELDKAKNELDASKETLAEGERELLKQEKLLKQSEEDYSKGKNQLEQQEKELAQKRTELESAQDMMPYEQYVQAIGQIEEAEAILEQEKGTLASKETELLAGKEQFEKAKAQLSAGKVEYEAGLTKYENGKAEYESGLSAYKDGLKEYEDGKKAYEDGQKDYEDGLKDYEDGLKDYEDGEAEYADGQSEFDEKLADAKQKLADAEKELREVEEPTYYVLDRNTNVGYVCFESDSNIVAGVANVFPVFFFLVAALVCVTTMSRMVEEQRTQIGVLKALGYGNGSIMGKYVFYSGSAAISGCIAGFLLGTWGFPKVIWFAYQMMYNMGNIFYVFDTGLAVISLLASVACSVGVTIMTCWVVLTDAPANLIRPRAPKNGKRTILEYVPIVWNRLSFLQKVSLRNIFRYKKRFFMMIVGISGCTALLVTGYGIKDSVSGIADLQYEEVQVYDIEMKFTDSLSLDEQEKFTESIADSYDKVAYRMEQAMDLEFGGQTKSIYMEVPEVVSEHEDIWYLHDGAGNRLKYPGENEAILTEKIAGQMGIQVGDRIVLRDSKMNQMEVKVIGLCENYVYNYVYIDPITYENQMQETPKIRSAYGIVKEGVDLHEAAAMAAEKEKVLSVQVIQDMRDRIAAMMKSMDIIVVVVIISAAALAFIVLYNLTNINIMERLREIATIKVLGFYANETALYVFRENFLLTAIGALVGLLLGKWLHRFVMSKIVIDMISFGCFVSPLHYVLSVVFTFAFAIIVNVFMYKKLDRIDMAESLKSVE